MDPARALYSISSTQTRWQRTSQEKSQGCAQWHPVGASNRCTLERPAGALAPRTRHATAGSRLRPGRMMYSNRSLPNLMRIFTSEGASIYVKPLSMAVSPPQKKGSFCRPYEAWQGDEDHGDRRRLWSFCRH